MSEQDLKTKDQELEEVQAPEAKEDSTQIDEFKASMGDPSEVPEPTSKTASAPGPSKDQGEKTPPKQGSSKMEKPKEVGTKMGMINAMVKKMSRMNKSAINSMYGNMMSGMKKPMMGEEAETEVAETDVPSQEYKVTPQDIDIKADVKALFGNEDLSEEFKDKAATIFETAVVTKINEHIDIYNTTVQSSYEEDVKSIKEEMASKMDSYMDYVVEQWADDNKLAVEQGLKNELVEDFFWCIRILMYSFFLKCNPY